MSRVIKKHEMKPGYEIFSVGLHLVDKRDSLSYEIEFVIAQSETEAENRAAKKYAAREFSVRSAEVNKARNPNINRYAMADRFLGFREGVYHPNFETSPYTVADVDALVDRLFLFTEKGRRTFGGEKEAAEVFLRVWDSLGFIDVVGSEFQASGLTQLRKIADGAITGSAAQEYLHSVLGMFNQTRRTAVNYAPSATAA